LARTSPVHILGPTPEQSICRSAKLNPLHAERPKPTRILLQIFFTPKDFEEGSMASYVSRTAARNVISPPRFSGTVSGPVSKWVLGLNGQ
jgi:hypothetical protein